MIDASVIIVSYNTADVITSCINSIRVQKDVTYEIIVVDNASTDNSLEILAKIDLPGKLIAGDKNVGFGCGCNLGFRQAKGRFILIINPDAKLRKNNDLRRMVNYMDNHLECGMMGPSVLHKDKPTPPRFHYLGEEYPGHRIKDLPGDIAWITGACMMIPYAVYESVHGFDEDFFLYAEETDLALRIRRLGLTISYYPDVAVDHIGGASEVKTLPREFWVRMQNGRHTFYRKHYSRDQIQSILSKKTKSAQRQLFFLRIRRMLGMLSGKEEEKILRNQVVIETSRAFLNELADT